ncbi:hypothetical protein AKO1_003197 [Acrasis kona]|uniref:Para n=1 Tax=Acrasis kona TaxID=1008807 RepID=A0AAW2ZKK2_9EUKA
MNVTDDEIDSRRIKKQANEAHGVVVDSLNAHVFILEKNIKEKDEKIVELQTRIEDHEKEISKLQRQNEYLKNELEEAGYKPVPSMDECMNAFYQANPGFESELKKM